MSRYRNSSAVVRAATAPEHRTRRIGTTPGTSAAKLEPVAVNAARRVCAVRRSVVSPLQTGGTRREVLGLTGLP